MLLSETRYSPEVEVTLRSHQRFHLSIFLSLLLLPGPPIIKHFIVIGIKKIIAIKLKTISAALVHKFIFLRNIFTSSEDSAGVKGLIKQPKNMIPRIIAEVANMAPFHPNWVINLQQMSLESPRM